MQSTLLNPQLKKSSQVAKLKLIKKSTEINQENARRILVESFIGEYQQYLYPNDVAAHLTSWRDGVNSVEDFYHDYFASELHEFNSGILDFWVEAYVDDQLAGWATFQIEPYNNKEIYMNLLVVDPKYQKMGLGFQLVHSILNLKQIDNLSAINLLIRKKNIGGEVFYSKLGFKTNPAYKRDNFVDPNLLTGLTWVNDAI